jgi:hypothetical protein
MQDSLGANKQLTWQDTAYFVTSANTAEVVDRESLFSGHLLRIRNQEMMPVQRQEASGLAFYLILGLMAVVLFANMRGGLGPMRVFRAAFDGAMLNTLVRIGTSSDQRVPVQLFLSGVLSIGLFASIIAARVSGMAGPELEDSLGLAGVVLIYMLGTRWANRVLSTMAGNTQMARSYGVVQGVLVTSVGVALLPVSLIALYGPGWLLWPSLIIGTVLLGWFVLSDLIRSVVLLMSDTATRAHHIIYYFCTLKILPLSVVVRAVMGN